MNKKLFYLVIISLVSLLLIICIIYLRKPLKQVEVSLDNSESQDITYIKKNLGKSGFEIVYPEAWSIKGITESRVSNKYVDGIRIEDNLSNQISIVIRKSDLVEIEQMRIEDENAKKGIFPKEYTGYIGYQDLPKRDWHELSYYPCEIQLLKVGELQYCRSFVEIDSYDNKYKAMIYVVKDNQVSSELETKGFNSVYDYLQITYTFQGNPFETKDYDYKKVLEEMDKAVSSLLISANEK